MYNAWEDLEAKTSRKSNRKFLNKAETLKNHSSDITIQNITQSYYVYAHIL